MTLAEDVEYRRTKFESFGKFKETNERGRVESTHVSHYIFIL